MAQLGHQVFGENATFPAGENLSTHQFRAVKMSGDNVVLAGAGEKAIGILQNDPVSGQEANVRLFGGGIFKAKAGGAITAGAWLKVDTNGELVATTTDTDVIVGQAIKAADENDHVLFVPVVGTLAG